MNTQTQEALKMAIEAFELEESTWWSHTKMAKAYQACKEALEQPAQEPSKLEMAGFELDGVIADIKLSGEFDCVSYDTVVRVRKTISDYVAQPSQEPINNCPNCNSWFTKEIHSIPAPSWQGLSDKEIIKIIEACEDKLERHLVGATMIAVAIEQALRSKNDY